MARPPGKRTKCTGHKKRPKDAPRDQPLEPCGAWAAKGSNVCRMHGAAGGRPPEHGRYSKHVGRLREGYEAARADRGLLDLREPIAALDAIVRRLAERVEELDTPDYRRTLVTLLLESRGSDAVKASAARLAMEMLIERGAEEDQTLTVLRDSLSELAKRIEGAWKVKLDKKHALGAAEQRVLFARFLDIVAVETSLDVAQRVGARLRGELGVSRN